MASDITTRLKAIKREHVLAAIEEVKRDGVPPAHDSKKHYLIHEGASYPQKHVASLATRYASGAQLMPDKFNARQSLPIFESLGFTIRTIEARTDTSAERMTIGGELIGELYYYAKEVHEGGIPRDEALEALEITPATAGAYFDDFQRMRRGEIYQRTMNAEATEYFLEYLHQDYGIEGLRLALQAVDKHLLYYDTVGKGSQRQIRAIWQKYSVIAEEAGERLFFNEVGAHSGHIEGGTGEAMRSYYKRNPKARTDCLAHYGYRCVVCAFDFEETYGAIGHQFIHVHHENEMALSGGQERIIDPIKDLKPVCPNCHAMLHQETPALSIEELRTRLRPAL